MRYRSLGWIIMSAWIGVWPIAAHADYLATARDSMKKGDLKSAQIDLRNAIRTDPQNAEAHFWLARVSLELGDPVAAEREAVAARDRGFDSHQTIPVLAQALLTQNKFQDLLNTLKPDGKDPQLDAAILVSRGYALIGLHQNEDAQHAFAEAERAAPNAVEPLLADSRLSASKGDIDGALGKVDRAIAAQPKSPEALLAKAQLLRMKGDIPGATMLLDGLIKDQPSVVQARLDRATLELAAGKLDGAQADIDMVLKATPGNVQGLYLQAVLMTQAKNYQAADMILDKISGYLGRIQRAYYLQAIIKEQLGQIEQAEDAARKYLGRSPNDLAAYKVLARIEYAKRRPDQVIDTLAKVAESGKADAETYDLLGRAYATAGRGPEAIQMFQKAQALAPNDVGLQTRLASVRMGMGDPDTAMGDLEHTLAMAPKLPAVGEALFFAALATGDMSKAQDALNEIKDAGGQPDIVGNLEGLYKMAQIDLPGAKATFAGLVQKYPDFIPAKINLARTDLMLGDTQAAEQILTDILAKQPTLEPALGTLVAVYRQSGRTGDSVTLLQKAHTADPANVRVTVSLGDTYLRNNEPQKAMDLVAAEKPPQSDSIEVRSIRAAAYLGLGEKKAARDIYEQILKQDPNIVGARRQLVAIMLEAGDFDSARSAITAGIAVSPRNYQLYQDLVMIDLKATGVDAALATADRLINQDRQFTELRALKGDIYLAANRAVDAIQAYQDADKATPTAAMTIRVAGAMLRAGRTADATKYLQAWSKAHPDDLGPKQQLAEIGILTKNFPDAISSLEDILKQKPHDPVTLNNLAWLYQQTGNDAKAQSLARQAYILSPGPQTADTLGWILTTGGKPGDGLALLRQASAENATDPRIIFHYAVALKDTGNKAEAKKQLETVVATKGDFQEKTDAQKLLDDMAKGS
jgi:cellulose synthase operon protein C